MRDAVSRRVNQYVTEASGETVRVRGFRGSCMVGKSYPQQEKHF